MPADDELLQEVPTEFLKPMVHINEDITEPVEEEAEPVVDAQSAFDPRYREPFIGLLYLGKLSEEFVLFGHSFLMETPNQATRLETGVLHKRYLNSMSSEMGWQTVTVAAYLQKVDGTPLPEPIGPKDTGLLDRLNWILENINTAVINALFERTLILDSKVRDVMEELERLGESSG